MGHTHAISDSNERPDLDDVMTPTEEAHPDRREHAKETKHLDDAELAQSNGRLPLDGRVNTPEIAVKTAVTAGA